MIAQVAGCHYYLLLLLATWEGFPPIVNWGSILEYLVLSTYYLLLTRLVEQLDAVERLDT